MSKWRARGAPCSCWKLPIRRACTCRGTTWPAISCRAGHRQRVLRMERAGALLDPGTRRSQPATRGLELPATAGRCRGAGQLRGVLSGGAGLPHRWRRSLPTRVRCPELPAFVLLFSRVMGVRALCNHEPILRDSSRGTAHQCWPNQRAIRRLQVGRRRRRRLLESPRDQCEHGTRDESRHESGRMRRRLAARRSHR